MTTAPAIRVPITNDREDRNFRRDCTLRGLLSLAAAHDLLLPTRIDFMTLVFDGEDLRTLNLGLDNDSRAEITRWAEVIGAEITDLDVTGHNATWTLVTAATPWRDEPDLDWHRIQIESRCDSRDLPRLAVPATRAA